MFAATGVFTADRLPEYRETCWWPARLRDAGKLPFGPPWGGKPCPAHLRIGHGKPCPSAFCFAGGAIGLLLAESALRWLIHARHDVGGPDSIHVDSMVIVFTLGVMIVCGLLVGLIPALSSNDKHILTTLQESSRSYSGGHARLAQTAWAAGLAGGLDGSPADLCRSPAEDLYEATSCGYRQCKPRRSDDGDQLYPAKSYRTPEQIVSFYERLTERVRQLPECRARLWPPYCPGEAANVTMSFPSVNVAHCKGQVLDASTFFVDPNYFSTLQIPLQGRLFQQPDEGLDRTQAGGSSIRRLSVSSSKGRARSANTSCQTRTDKVKPGRRRAGDRRCYGRRCKRKCLQRSVPDDLWPRFIRARERSLALWLCARRRRRRVWQHPRSTGNRQYRSGSCRFQCSHHGPGSGFLHAERQLRRYTAAGVCRHFAAVGGGRAVRRAQSYIHRSAHNRDRDSGLRWEPTGSR